MPHPSTLGPPQSPALGWELCSPLTWAHPPHRAAAPSIALAEEPGLPPGHAGPPGTDSEWPWAPGGVGGCPCPHHCPHSLPAPPRASLCSLSASTSWSCCWMMLQCHGASRYPGGRMGQLRVVSLTGLGTIPPQPAPSSSCRTHPWARFPSPSLVPLELHCRLSSFCILQAGTCVPSEVPCVPNAVPSAIPSCFHP